MTQDNIGKILIKAGVISDEDLFGALSIQQRNGSRLLGEILMEEFGIEEQAINETYARYFNLIYTLDLNYEIPVMLQEKIPLEYCIKYEIVPLSEDESGISIATDALSRQDLWKEDLSLLLGKEIRPVITNKKSIILGICSAYGVNEEEYQERRKQYSALDRGEQEVESHRLDGDHELLLLSDEMKDLGDRIRKVAQSDASVIFLGETGTGKELFAALLHNASNRRKGPFIKLNCAAIPETLMESELFGHEKGAFTGAHNRKIGKFEIASGGTLFLDEVGELTLTTQVKLLRVLQDQRFERLGGSTTIKTDVRIVSATNRNLEHEMEAGRFRSDLYFRLNVVSFHIPPLRNRKDEIFHLVEYFIRMFALKNDKEVRNIRSDAMELLVRYDWPGNVRELKNCIEYAVIVCETEIITLSHIPEKIKKKIRLPEEKSHENRIPLNVDDVATGGNDPIHGSARSDFTDTDRIINALKQTGFNKSRAAKILGMHRNTLFRKMKELGIQSDT